MNYVLHFCRNRECNNAWIDKDLTHSQNIPPKWKYCRKCAEKLGINYNTQTPDSNLTEKELTHKNKLRERIKKANETRLQKIDFPSTGTMDFAC